MTRKITEKTVDTSPPLDPDLDQAHILHPNKRRKSRNISISSSHTKKSLSISSTGSAALDNKSVKETHEPNTKKDVENRREEDKTESKSEYMSKAKDPHPNYELLIPNLISTTWINCGKLAIELNSNYSIAIKCFESALKYHPSDLVTINLLVDSLVNRDYASNKVDGVKNAIDLINSAMVSYPEVRDDTKLCAKLSNYYLLMNDPEKAHSVIQTALEFAKDDPLLWLSLGKCLLKMNSLKEAVDALGNASYLLPKELTGDAEVNIARSIHLEMASVALNDQDLKSAKDELSLALSLPAPTDSQSIEMCITLIRHLVVLFERTDDPDAAAWICEFAESKFPEEPIILLLHSYLLLSPDNSLFNPSKARSLLHNIIQKDRYYIKSDNVVDFVQSTDGDFLPWLLLSKCYDFLEHYNIAFDCLEISARKIAYPAELSVFRSLAKKILKASNNSALAEYVQPFIDALDSSPHTVRDIPLMDLIVMSYDERVDYFKAGESATRDESKGKRRKSNIGGTTGKRKIDEVINEKSKLSSPKQVYYDLTRDDSLNSNSRASVSAQVPVPPSAAPNVPSTPQIVSPLLSSQIQQQTPVQTQPQHPPQQHQQMYSVIQGPVYTNVSSPASQRQPVAFSARPMPQQQQYQHQQHPQQQDAQWAHVNPYPQNKNAQYNSVGHQMVPNNEPAVFSPADTNIPTLVENSAPVTSGNMSNGRLTSPAKLNFQQERQYIPIVHQQSHAQPLQIQHQSRHLMQPNISPPQHHVQMMEAARPGQPRFQSAPGTLGPRIVGPNGQIMQQVHLIQGPVHNQPRPGSRMSSNGQGQLPMHGQLPSSIEEQRVQYTTAPGYPQMSNRIGFARQPNSIPPPGMVNGAYIAYEQPGRHYIDEQVMMQQ